MNILLSMKNSIVLAACLLVVAALACLFAFLLIYAFHLCVPLMCVNFNFYM